LPHIYREREAVVNQSLALASYFIDQKAETRRKSETGHRVTSRLLTLTGFVLLLIRAASLFGFPLSRVFLPVEQFEDRGHGH
jgi:hypothetical protein